MRAICIALVLLMASAATGQVSSSSKRRSQAGKAPTDSTSSQDSQPLYEPHQGTPPKPPVHMGPDIKATDAERTAVAFTSYDLDVRLVPAQHAIAVRALLKARNDSDQPLLHLPLQVSSSLEWETVRIDGKEAQFGLQTINSDADHTGQLREAVVVLPQPLLPGKQIALDVVYRGVIELTARRLEAIGTPSDVAQRSDWDRITPEFTGLRGFGNVAWYPVSSVPVALGDGARLFIETGRQKQRQSSAMVQLKVSIEYSGSAPNLAILDGHPLSIAAGTPPEDAADIPLIATCTQPPHLLGFTVPSLIIANRIEQVDLRSALPGSGSGSGSTGSASTGPGSTGPRMNAYLRAGDEPSVDSYLAAMARVTPLLEQWLGAAQKVPLTLVDLPGPGDASFETGAALLAALHTAPVDKLTATMAHALTHSYFHSSREWLNEGVPYFVGTLWAEKSDGRDAALGSLDSAALALAEPASPVDGDAQDLLHATDPVYYRSKAAYVLWMLRDLAGDAQLSAALRDYDPAADTSSEYFEHLLERKRQDGTPARELKWFFDDWVYRDRGLPDLSIEAVYPTPSAAQGSYVVAVNVANAGYAAAEVPLTVRSGVTSITERVLLPARSKISHRLLIQGWPTEVTLNDGTVPEVQRSQHATAIDPAKEPH